jgi:hypothetical protein
MGYISQTHCETEAKFSNSVDGLMRIRNRPYNIIYNSDLHIIRTNASLAL